MTPTPCLACGHTGHTASSCTNPLVIAARQPVRKAAKQPAPDRPGLGLRSPVTTTTMPGDSKP